jgi:hypothetical protein
VGTAKNNRTIVHFLDSARCAPCLLHLGRVGCDADNVRSEFLDKLGYGLPFHIGVEDPDLIAAAFADSGKVGQAQMGCCSSVNGEPKSRID